MLKPPDLPNKKIITYLQTEYNLAAPQVTFLPLGADLNTTVYRVITEDGTPYFLKLRSGVFDEMSVRLPKFFSDQGIQQIIPPLATVEGQLWGNLGTFKTILYPFIEGRDGYEVKLSDHHWGEFSTALKQLHSAPVPNELVKRVRKETYSPHWRDQVKTFMARIEVDHYQNPIAVEVAAFLQTKRTEVFRLLKRAEELAEILRFASSDFVLCHSDLHAGNLLISDNALYIVDWDEPILAPKERDLMYIGGGLMGLSRSAEEEEKLFYATYGKTSIDRGALAYYRYERILRDIAEYCEQLLLSDEGRDDRELSLHYLKSNFLPNGTIELAYRVPSTRS